MKKSICFAVLGVTLSPCCVLCAAPAEIATPEVLDGRLALDLFCHEPDIVTPIAIDVDARGRVWAIESNTHFRKPDYPGHDSDRVLVIEDLDRNGRADRFTVFADGFRQAMALKLLDAGNLLLASRREIYLLEDRDGDGICDRRRSLTRLETPGKYPHNGLSGFAVDDLGNIYFSLGENLGADYRLLGADGVSLEGGGEGGNIYRMRPDGSGLVCWATGFWNTFHLSFDAFGNLFAVDNDPDSRPPCRLLHIVRGGDYGYRFWLGRKGLHPFTAWNGELPGTLPMICGSGEAPSGLVAYEHVGLPRDYHGHLFATSWGDHRLEVFRLSRRGASFRSYPEALVRGGETFRPVGLAVAPDGSLFFTDWVDQDYHVHRKGRIWRLRARSAASAGDAHRRVRTPLESGAGFDAVERLLSHPVRSVRRRAVGDLLRLPGGAALARDVLRRSDSPRGRYHALVLLACAGELRPSDCETAEAAAGAGALEEVSVAAVRLVGEAGRDDESQTVGRWLREKLDDPHPGVRLEALLALRRADGLGEALLGTAASDEDPFLTGAALDALARLVDPEELRKATAHPDARRRLAALLALRRLGGAGRSSAPFIIKRLDTSRSLLSTLLADEDLGVRGAAMQWVAEAGRRELREELQQAFERGPFHRELFDAYLAGRTLLEGGKPTDRDRRSRDEFLFEMARDHERPAPLRVMALRSVTAAYAGWSAESARGFLREKDSRLRLEAVRSLRESTVPEAPELLAELASDRGEEDAVRREAVVGLALFAERKRGVLLSLLENGAPGIRREAARALRVLERDESLRGKLESVEREFASDGPERGTEAWQHALLRGGNPAEGEIVFFHPRGARCSSCHTVRGRGGSAGPDLSATGRNSREKLLESILEPSREVAPQYVTWVIVTADGPRTGILLGDEPDGTLRLGTVKGAVERIPARAILSRQLQKTSLMPQDLAAQMSFRELRDLLAYLESLR